MKKTLASEKKHAKFSASGSERWMFCPGSVSLSENAPPQKESPYAMEGTKAHECLEEILKQSINGLTPQTRVVNAFILGRYPKDMQDHVRAAAQEILKRRSESAELLCETKVSLEFVAPDMFGTVDAALVEEFGDLHVFDFKYGKGIVVNPEENSQMVYYALGLAHKYHYNFDRVHLTIIQPRAEHEDGTTRTWTTDIHELKRWEHKFREGVKAAEDPFAPHIAGDWCRWCPAKAICPEISSNSLKEAQIDFDVKSAGDATAIVLPKTSMIPARNLSGLLTAFDKIETWIQAVREYALQSAERGVKIPGYKVVEKRSTRKWIDIKKTEREAGKLFGAKAFTTPELLSPAQLEKQFKNSKTMKWIESRVSNVSSGVTLVPESDSRRELKNQVEADFSEHDDGSSVSRVMHSLPAKKVSSSFKKQKGVRGSPTIKRSVNNQTKIVSKGK